MTVSTIAIAIPSKAANSSADLGHVGTDASVITGGVVGGVLGLGLLSFIVVYCWRYMRHPAVPPVRNEPGLQIKMSSFASKRDIEFLKMSLPPVNFSGKLYVCQKLVSRVMLMLT